jgi:hypothetical protein
LVFLNFADFEKNKTVFSSISKQLKKPLVQTNNPQLPSPNPKCFPSEFSLSLSLFILSPREGGGGGVVEGERGR